MTRRSTGSARLIVFLLVAGTLSIVLVAYTILHQPPKYPADGDHLTASGPDRCLACHGPDGRRPRGANHPQNNQCFSCHERV
ncbi:MAG: hypothetical protein AUI47_05765 [Acidobacteria bacterium 13_1_40CM_2_68_5]|nr:MAG: hypothetical protein AUI47_05765 [Acidobacteria bacterium 13_1_40CM_2_68_5]